MKTTKRDGEFNPSNKEKLNKAIDNGLTVSEYVAELNKSNSFNESAQGFKMNINPTAEQTETKPTAQEIINGVEFIRPSSPSYFKDTRPIKSPGLISKEDKYTDLGFEVEE